ncbi:hypothetical protein ACFL43_06915 [Thermodesulfobacteriota bacterium]
MLIENCSSARRLDKSLGKKGLCFLAGKGKKYYKIKKLYENTRYAANKIRHMLQIKSGLQVAP